MNKLVTRLTGMMHDGLESMIVSGNDKFDFLTELSIHYEKIFINILLLSFNCKKRSDLRDRLLKYINNVSNSDKNSKAIMLEFNTQIMLTYDVKPITKPASNKYLAHEYISKYTEYCVGYDIDNFIKHELTGCMFINGLKCIHGFDPKDIIFLLTNYQLSQYDYIMLNNSTFCKQIDMKMVKETVFENIIKSFKKMLNYEYNINIIYKIIDKTDDLKSTRWYNSIWFTSGQRSCTNEYSCKIIITPNSQIK